MTITEFATTYSSTLQALFSGLGLISILLLWHQIKQTNKWNKLRAEQTFYSNYSRELSSKLYKELENIGISIRLRETPLSIEEVETIFNDKNGNAYYALIEYLNDLEVTAMSILAGKVDEVVAYETHNVRLNNAIKQYSHAIDKIRKFYSGTNVFSDMFVLQEKWLKNETKIKNKIEKQNRVKSVINRFIDKILYNPLGTKKRI